MSAGRTWRWSAWIFPTSAAPSWCGGSAATASARNALREVWRGGRFFDPSFAGGEEGARQAKALSSRESEILGLLADGLTGEQIAKRLVLSPETVRTHVRNAMEKLGAPTRTAAVVKAIELEEVTRG